MEEACSLRCWKMVFHHLLLQLAVLREEYSTLHSLMEKFVGSGKTALQKERREEPQRRFQSSSGRLQGSHRTSGAPCIHILYQEVVEGQGWAAPEIPHSLPLSLFRI